MAARGKRVVRRSNDLETESGSRKKMGWCDWGTTRAAAREMAL